MKIVTTNYKPFEIIMSNPYSEILCREIHTIKQMTITINTIILVILLLTRLLQITYNYYLSSISTSVYFEETLKGKS